MQFDIDKYKEIMKHIDEEDDMEIVSFTEWQSWMLPDLSVQRKTTNGLI